MNYNVDNKATLYLDQTLLPSLKHIDSKIYDLKPEFKKGILRVTFKRTKFLSSFKLAFIIENEFRKNIFNIVYNFKD